MKEKCLEYYLDASLYSNEEIQQSIDNTKKEFSDKKVYVNITLNEFGVYVITFYFENKNTIWNRIRLYFKKRQNKKQLMIQEKSILQEFRYGEYKSFGKYRPY